MVYYHVQRVVERCTASRGIKSHLVFHCNSQSWAAATLLGSMLYLTHIDDWPKPHGITTAARHKPTLPTHQHVCSTMYTHISCDNSNSEFWRKAASHFTPLLRTECPCCMPLLTTERSFCCVHHSSDCQCFSMGQTTPKITHSGRENWTSHPIHGFWGPRGLATQMASLSVQPFLQGSRTSATDRHTDRRTEHTAPSVAIDRI